MKRIIILGCGCLLALALVAGCSDDKATNTTKHTGNPADPDFLATQEQVFGLSDMAMSSFEDIYRLIGSIATGASTSAPTVPATIRVAGKTLLDTVEYHDVSGYWYYEARDTFTFGSTSTEFLEIDSVQFMQGTEAVQFPDSELVTAIKVGAHNLIHDLVNDDSLASTMAVTFAGAAGELAGGGDATIDGSGHVAARLSYDTAATACVLDLGFAVNYDNLALNLTGVFENDGCPTGGAISHAGSLGLACDAPADTLNFDGQWATRLTFSGENIAYAVENPTTRWSGTTTCDALRQAAARYTQPYTAVLRSAQR